MNLIIAFKATKIIAFNTEQSNSKDCLTIEVILELILKIIDAINGI